MLVRPVGLSASRAPISLPVALVAGVRGRVDGPPCAWPGPGPAASSGRPRGPLRPCPSVGAAVRWPGGVTQPSPAFGCEVGSCGEEERGAPGLQVGDRWGGPPRREEAEGGSLRGCVCRGGDPSLCCSHLALAVSSPLSSTPVSSSLSPGPSGPQLFFVPVLCRLVGPSPCPPGRSPRLLATLQPLPLTLPTVSAPSPAAETRPAVLPRLLGPVPRPPPQAEACCCVPERIAQEEEVASAPSPAGPAPLAAPGPGHTCSRCSASPFFFGGHHALLVTGVPWISA